MTLPAYQIGGRACDAAAFYALACDPQRSVVVEACAGAGKTWMLVSRIVRVLLDGVGPDQILAITFTRKAAGEMRARLHDWLRDWSAASAAERIAALVARGLDATRAHELQAALGALHARLAAAGAGVQIHTFHGWYARLLRGAPTDLLGSLGLHAGMQLVEEIDDFKPELMLRFQQEICHDAALRADYEALTARHRRTTLASWFDAVLDHRTEIEAVDRAGELDEGVETADRRWRECRGLAHPSQRLRSDAALRATLQTAARELAAQPAKPARTAGQRLADALALDDVDEARAHVRGALWTRDGDPRAAVAEVPAARAAIDACTVLEEQVAQHEAADDHRRMARLARALLAQWRAIKRERALVDMPDLERCAHAVLSDPVASGWVQERLDVRTRQVLIDEFQDTSPLQWHALQAWLGAYAGAGGGVSGQRPPALFVVGDPKQSIYRFRRAEPRVFELARRFVVDGLDGQALACNHTRRCAPDVVALLNTVFGAAAAHQYPGFVAHSTAADPARPGRVSRLAEPAIEPSASRPLDPTLWRDSLTVPRMDEREPRATDEARRVAQAVDHLIGREGFAPGDVLVLARRRASLAPVADALAARNLPCVAAESLKLAELVEVQDLVAVLDVLASPGHELSLAQALKSPLFGADDAMLLDLANRADGLAGATRWWDALRSWADAPPVMARARALLARWGRDARVLPPHDLLDRVVDQGDVLGRLAARVPAERFPQARAAVTALLEQSLAVDGGRYLSVYRFVRALRQRAWTIPAPVRPDAVQLMTIHGAKGLEARAVLVVDGDAQPPREAVPDVLIDWPVERSRPNRVAFVANARQVAPTLRPIQLREAAAAAREELNALYVAITRASEVLLFSRTLPQRPSPGLTWWGRVQPHTECWQSDAVAASDADRHGALARLPALPSRASAIVDEPDEDSDDLARRLGRAVHRVLQWSAREVAPPSDRLLAWAREAAIEFGLPGHAVPRVGAIVTKMRGSTDLARYFDPQHVRWAGDEVELAVDGTVVRIDRLVRLTSNGGSRWWVLDYKLDALAAGDPTVREQLERYCAAVRLVAGDEPVNAAVVSADGGVYPLI